MKGLQLICIVLVFCSLGRCAQDLPVVPNFDVEKYMGHWYMISGIASIVDFFCICTQTTYQIDATNSSIVRFDEFCRPASWLPFIHSHSYAEVDPVEQAKWTNVNPIVGSLAARADYYIIGVDDAYTWSLVGSRDRGNLYVLARNRTMDNSTYSIALEKASSLGFDVSKLGMSEQSVEKCGESAFLSL